MFKASINNSCCLQNCFHVKPMKRCPFCFMLHSIILSDFVPGSWAPILLAVLSSLHSSIAKPRLRLVIQKVEIVSKITKVKICHQNGNKQCNNSRLGQLLQQCLFRLGTTTDSFWRWRHKTVPRHKHGNGRHYPARNCPHRNNDYHRIRHPRRREQLHEVSDWQVCNSFHELPIQAQFPGLSSSNAQTYPVPILHRAQDSRDEDEKEISLIDVYKHPRDMRRIPNRETDRPIKDHRAGFRPNIGP